jgi:peptidoglycan-associated lipoprotein
MPAGQVRISFPSKGTISEKGGLMKKLFIILMIAFALLVFFDACKKKGPETEPVQEQVEKVDEDVPKVDRPVLSEEEIFEKRSLEEANKAGYLKKVFFDFDKYDIKDSMKPVLHRNADWLLKHPRVEILLEGHCDERGTFEYNMALGEKRAESSLNYLISLGIKPERVKIISYGKTRPVVKGVDEESHYQNRRVEFVIIKK